LSVTKRYRNGYAILKVDSSDGFICCYYVFWKHVCYVLYISSTIINILFIKKQGDKKVLGNSYNGLKLGFIKVIKTHSKIAPTDNEDLLGVMFGPFCAIFVSL
jgi:hypothetical protein